MLQSGLLRVADHPGVDRLGQHCRVFVLQWIDLERLVVPRTGAQEPIFSKTVTELLQLRVFRLGLLRMGMSGSASFHNVTKS